METVVNLSSLTYHDILSNLQAIDNKDGIRSLRITETYIIELSNQFFNGLNNLIDLDLSNCNIYNFERNVFDNLIYLQSINLSNNFISLIDNRLFENNVQLRTVILKQNLLNSINKIAFLMVASLQLLDLSYNYISAIDSNCLVSASLQGLYLNSNQIRNIMPTAFDLLPNLYYLALDDNKIPHFLHENTFRITTNLRYLNLSNNRINRLSSNSFLTLKYLRSLHLRNNLLTQIIDVILFSQNSVLTELDLSDNRITELDTTSLNGCPNLRLLILKICERFKIHLIRNLVSLNKFELVYDNEISMFLNKAFWDEVRPKSQLTVLKLIIRKIEVVTLIDCSNLVNLKYFHIECQEPNSRESRFTFRDNFYGMKNLIEIVLKNINGFTVHKMGLYENRNLEYLNLTGVKTSDFKYVFYSFSNLKYLNLSFSAINVFGWSVFNYLTDLEHLDLRHTKMKSITLNSFKLNRKLRYLNCSNCLIETIEDCSFQHLTSLLTLDLSNNMLRDRTENTFFGLRTEICVIIL